MDTKARLILLALIVIFVVHAHSLLFAQDDAFISYRYVKNFVAGKGLVFNPGERVEGYTNFLWIVLLIVAAKLGVGIPLVSKILGVASGCVTLILVYLLSGLILRRGEADGDSQGPDDFWAWILRLSPCLLLVSNSAFAYWSISGLETTFFAMAVLLSLYFYLKDERLVVPVCVLATLIRPEGILVFALIVAHRFFFERRGFRSCLRWVFLFVLLLLPFLIFRIFYYGDILPNPFYAKTGLSLEYVKAGVAYLWLFLRHYGLWGILYLMPLVAYRQLGSRGRVLLLVVYGYTLYIVFVGGDVLRAHRFFVPLLPLLYVLFALALFRLRSIGGRLLTGEIAGASVVVGFCFLTFFLPRAWILWVRKNEIGLCASMKHEAQVLSHAFGDEITVAMTTIGAFSWAGEMRVIDMLGLTDPYIAKNPEETEGITSRWKERNYNTRYLLSLDPDIIIFSTGLKPSAPAEKALFLSSKFRDNYYPYYLPYGRISLVVYKKKGDYSKEDEVFADPRFVNMLAEAENLGAAGDVEGSLRMFEEIAKVAPEDWPRIHEFIAACHLHLGRKEEGKRHLKTAIELDDYQVWSHWALYQLYMEEGDTVAAMEEKRKVELYNPEMLFYVE